MPITFLLVAVGLVMVRSQGWSNCLIVEWSLLGGGAVGSVRSVPTWVPLLVGMVAAGHLLSGLRDRRCTVLELPPLMRAGAYVAAVALLVAFGPGATKAFIYFQF